MIKVVDLVYHYHKEYKDPKEMLAKQQPTLGFIPFLKDKINYTVIRHLNYEGKEITDGVRYACFRRRNAAWQIPFKTNRYIKSLDPDIVLVHGFTFPIQVIALRLLLKKKCAIVLQHHGELPAHSPGKFFQKIAGRFVDAYIFTAAGIADPWIAHGIISSKNKVVEIQEASAFIEKKTKQHCKKQLGFTGNYNFLWVGRLNKNKDPITIVKAFAEYIHQNPSAVLYMIYQTVELLNEIKEIIAQTDHLCDHIQLVGEIPAANLTDWYHAADYFISGSYGEAAGYALLEAMSSGCIPVVTTIPAFEKLLNGGKIGFMFAPGDEKALLALLHQLTATDIRQQSAAVEKYFLENLHFKNIAADIFNLFTQLNLIKR